VDNGSGWHKSLSFADCLIANGLIAASLEIERVIESVPSRSCLTRALAARAWSSKANTRVIAVKALQASIRLAHRRLVMTCFGFATPSHADGPIPTSNRENKLLAHFVVVDPAGQPWRTKPGEFYVSITSGAGDAAARFAKEGRPELSRLRTQLDGVDPDIAHSIVPYEKGALFQSTIELAARKKRFRRLPAPVHRPRPAALDARFHLNSSDVRQRRASHCRL
jgi:hypothetical protein